MRLIIITGISGAGKTQALRRLEDIGFFCVDNLPPTLLLEFAKICHANQKESVAVAIDMRMGAMFDDIYTAMGKLKEQPGVVSEILYLDASDEVLIRRFKETRRNHPLSPNVLTGITMERDKLHRIKGMAQNVLDTSHFLPRNLGESIEHLYAQNADISIVVMSFGFKRGIPLDADMVFDLRFIPNPFYQQELKAKTGLEREVAEYVFASPRAKEFVDRVDSLVNFVAPFYLEQDKKQLVLAFGCTGGMHRSVAVAGELFTRFETQGHKVFLQHRDIGLDLQKDV